MKRILLFLVVFGSGLALLLYLQGEQTGTAGSGGFEQPSVEPSPVANGASGAADTGAAVADVGAGASGAADTGAAMADVGAGASGAAAGAADAPGDLGEAEDLAPDPALTASAEDDEHLIAVPGPAGGTTGRAGLQGRIDYTRYPEEGGEALFTLTAADSNTSADGWLNLIDVRLEYFGEGVLYASEGRARLDPGEDRLGIGKLSDEIRLIDGRVELAEGHPLAPLEITGASFVGNLAERRFTIEGTPSLRSPRLDVDAAGIDMYLNENRLDAHGDPAGPLAARAVATVRDALGQEGRATHQLRGDLLSFRSQVLGADGATPALPGEANELPEEIELSARGRAEVQLLGVVDLGGNGVDTDEPVRLEAVAIRLHGTRQPGADVVLDALDVEGPGRLWRREGEVRGRSFDFAFDLAGRAGRVIVDGEPELIFRGTTGADMGTPGLTPDQPLRLTAQGPMNIALDGELEVLTESPAELSWGDLVFEADGGFRGGAVEGADGADGELRLHGTGGVRLVGELPAAADGAELGLGKVDYSAEAVDIDYTERGPELGPRVVLTSIGATHVQSWDAAGRRSELRCVEGLSFVLDGSDWTVPEGVGVDFVFETENGTWTGSSETLRDLDPAKLELEALGATTLTHVDLEGQRVSGSGARILLDGEDSILVEGDAVYPAHFEGKGLDVTTQFFERSGSTARALGGVVAEVEQENVVLDFSCNRLELYDLDLNSESPGAGRLVLEGAVDGEFRLAEQVIDLRCDELELLRVSELVALPDGEPRPELLELHAKGTIDFAWNDGEADWRVSCKQLDAFAREVPETERLASSSGDLPLDAWFELVASDGVIVRETRSGFFGSGATLHLDRGPVTRALLDGGDEPARVAGQLPGEVDASGRPVRYRGRVDELTILDQRILAKGIDLALLGLSLPGQTPLPELDPADENDGAREWLLTCDELDGNPTVLQLDGNVRFEGADGEGEFLRLLSNHATFRNEAERNEDGTRPAFAAMTTSVLAHGSVRLRRGLQYEAFGEDLILEPGGRLLRFEGEPAAIVYAGLCSMSTWIEFDPLSMLVESGPGSFTIDPILLKALLEEPLTE